MKSMGVNEIREKFLSFFESKGCLRLGSFPLIPKNDASLLLINSGMAPMKPWFQNPETAPKRRVTTCQKCIRTGDIENVGKTARHGTFFEMLGNFSFGDYFKKEATAWAWEFFTKVMEIPQERLWISVYEEDDEARDIWVNEVGVDPTHIVKLGKEDNFWEHGTGPCGPCSEIYFDRGEEYGCGEPGCGVGCECDRFMEVWNLVFTQFDKDEDGNYHAVEGGLQDGDMMIICAAIASRKNKTTRSNAQMAFLNVEDVYGSVECIVFPKVLNEFSPLLQEDNLVAIACRLSIREDEAPKILMQSVQLLDEALMAKKEPKRLYIQLETRNDENLKNVEKYLSPYQGDMEVRLFFKDTRKMSSVPRRLWFNGTENAIYDLKNIFGEDNVKIK